MPRKPSIPTEPPITVPKPEPTPPMAPSETLVPPTAETPGNLSDLPAANATDVVKFQETLKVMQEAYGADRVSYYLAANFHLADIPALEQTAADILKYAQDTGLGAKKLGDDLRALRKKFKYGSWQAYCKRLPASQSTIDNYITASLACEREPGLLAHPENIAPAVLYMLTKSLPDPALKRVAELAETRPVHPSDVRSLRHGKPVETRPAPPPPKSPPPPPPEAQPDPPLYLPSIPPEEALGFVDSEAERMLEAWNTVTDAYNLGEEHWEAIRQHPRCRDWILDVCSPFNTVTDHYMVQLQRYLVLAFTQYQRSWVGRSPEDTEGDPNNEE